MGMVEAWRREFQHADDVEVSHDDICDLAATAIVVALGEDRRWLWGAWLDMCGGPVGSSMKSGSIGRYHWGEFSNEEPGLTVPDVVRGIAGHLIGLRGVNASWDSGLLRPTDPALPPGWTYEGEHAVSPSITPGLATAWPGSDEGFDEWYFFGEVPALFNLNAFCNFMGLSLANASGVTFPGGITVREQLERWAPAVVVGQGHNIFVLGTDEKVVRTFSSLAREADGDDE
jgi:hypothetical protein